MAKTYETMTQADRTRVNNTINAIWRRARSAFGTDAHVPVRAMQFAETLVARGVKGSSYYLAGICLANHPASAA